MCAHVRVDLDSLYDHPTSSNNTQNIVKNLLFSILNPGGLGRAALSIPKVELVFKDQLELGHNFLPGEE